MKDMKKIAAFVMFALSGSVFGGAVFAQTGTLDTTISAVKTHIENALPRGSRVLVVCNAAARTVADYAADELSARLANGKRLTVVERSAAVVNALSAESSYQLSGEVDDDTIQDIGHKTGAEYLISGNISGGGDSWRLVVKAASVKSGELEGQWNAAFQTNNVLAALLANANPPRGQPEWTHSPSSAAEKHGREGWYYDIGVSQMAASEQLARTRARQNIQQMVAANIASEIKNRIDVTEFSSSSNSSIEDVERRFESALTNSIKTTIPRYEPLEWYIETGKKDGKDYYIAFMLARFPRKDIITMVEKYDTAKIADSVFRQMNITAPDSNLRTQFLHDLEAGREFALEGIRE